MPIRRPGFEHHLRLSSYLLLLCGFTALLLSEAVGAWFGIPYFAAAAVSWRYEVSFGTRAQALIVGILLVVFLSDHALFSDFVEATLHLLIMLSLLKLFGESKDRDYQLIYAISFVFLLIASAFTISVLYLVCLVVYVFLANLTFVLFESRGAYRENRTASFSVFGYLQVALLMTALIGLIAVPVFLAFPRSALGFLKTDDGFSGAQLSGFSDHVNLGDLGKIINDHRVFMRVRLEGRPAEYDYELKWRGVALDYYDGKAWKNTEKSYRYIQKNSQTRSFEVAETRAALESNLRQYFTVSAYSNVIFGASRVLQVFNLPGETIRQDEHGALTFLWARPRDGRSYVVDSGVMPRAARLRQVRSGPVPETLRQRYLQLEPLDPRIPDLARRVAGTRSTPLGKALVLESYLKTEFGYTLENPSGGASDPLTDFLFSTRQGHCEYFATAHAVLLRTLGIPSRVVNGFRLGELNQWNGSYIVRHSDAHSWTEAFFPGAGWVEFDPTPFASPGGVASLFRFADQFLDAVDVFWMEVITFDRLRQVGFFVTLGRELREKVQGLREYSEQLAGALLEVWEGGGRGLRWEFLAGVPLAAFLCWLVYRFRSRVGLLFRRQVLWKRSTDPACALYFEFLELMERQGHARAASETPREFALRMRQISQEDLPVLLTELYYRNRFGRHPVAPEEVQRMRMLIREL